jgi:hypothetical protein
MVFAMSVLGVSLSISVFVFALFVVFAWSLLVVIFGFVNALSVVLAWFSFVFGCVFVFLYVFVFALIIPFVFIFVFALFVVFALSLPLYVCWSLPYLLCLLSL